MSSIIGAIKNTISISLFNKGLAGKIFEEVKNTGAKVVMKNNVAECVLISPEEYVRLIDEINEARLLTTAMERMKNYDPKKIVPQKEVDEMFGFTDETLKNFEEVEFE